MRLKKWLFDQAVQLATTNQWEEAVRTNEQLLQLGEDAEVYNRLGKAWFELGRFEEAQEAYSSAMRLNPSNVIARKNIARLRELGGTDQDTQQPSNRTYADPQLF